MISKLFATLLVSLACSSLAVTQTRLTGAGSTFVYPVMSKWTGEYGKQKGTEVNYQSIGSGGGIRQVSEGVVDFGATDGPMNNEQLAAAKVGQILHIPVVMGADVPAYHVAGVPQGLKFTPKVLSAIFLGKITQWNDSEIIKANPGVNLPNSAIVVIHRSDGSGTTYIWTDYLSKVSPEWNSQVGTGTSVKWPVGLGAKGNEGVAGMIRQMDGAIGYVELIYAVHNNINYGTVQNSSGNFVKATVESVSAAAASAIIPPDFRYSITNAPGKDAYPISGTTWLLVPKKSRDATKTKALKDFAEWILTQGQDIAPTLDYAKLPPDLANKAKDSLKQIQ